jgi:ATP dependent DNA ligase domain
LEALPGKFAIDGEIVALDDRGHPSFQLLQNTKSRMVAVHFYAFDLLNHDGEELIALPIERRRELLNELMADLIEPLRLSPLLQAPAGEVLDAVRKLGLEGVVGKRAGSCYESGDRSGSWIKHRTDRAQEFVNVHSVQATKLLCESQALPHLLDKSARFVRSSAHHENDNSSIRKFAKPLLFAARFAAHPARPGRLYAFAAGESDLSRRLLNQRQHRPWR